MTSANEEERKEGTAEQDEPSHLPKWILLLQEVMDEERRRRRKRRTA
jgi:hypothetical protein